MDHKQSQAKEDDDWRESKKLVLYILEDLKARTQKCEDAIIAIRIKVAIAGAISGLIGSFIPYLIKALLQNHG